MWLNYFVSEEYTNLLSDVDLMAERLTERYRSHIACRAGCCACCRHDLSVFEVEAVSVRAALSALPEMVWEQVCRQAHDVQAHQARGEGVVCPLLVNGCCAIYEARPVICRTQGLPLLYAAEDGTQEVDFCPLNFTGTGTIEELDADHLVQLDVFNLKLASVNLDYCGSIGLPPAESGNRRPMSTLILETENQQNQGRPYSLKSRVETGRPVGRSATGPHTN